MSVKRIRDEGQTLTAPTGKILGIVDTRDEFDVLIQALKKAGYDKVGAPLEKRASRFSNASTTFSLATWRIAC